MAALTARHEVPLTEPELLALAEPVRRVARARLASDGALDGNLDEDTEDVVQETLARVLEVSARLERETLAAYAVITAKNLMTSSARRRDLQQRHASRLLDSAGPDGPDDVVLRAEEHAAIAAALRRLPRSEADLLLAHEVGDAGTRELAETAGTTPGAVAARLARARARLRVEFVLALRRVELPTPRCRAVLLAVSAGDGRRQRDLAAGAHVPRCPACAALCDALVSRRRGLVGLLPIPMAAAGGRPSRERSRSVRVLAARLAAAAAALVTVLAVTGLAVTGLAGTVPSVGLPPVARPPSDAAAAPTPASAPADVARVPRSASSSAGPSDTLVGLGSDGTAAALPPDGLRERAGDRVLARDVVVLSVPADEGFWIRPGAHTAGDAEVGRGERDRVWVQLRGAGESGTESAFRVRPGQRLAFAGTVEANPPGFPERVGLTQREGAQRLREQGAHLEVPAASLQRR